MASSSKKTHLIRTRKKARQGAKRKSKLRKDGTTRSQKELFESKTLKK